MFRVVRIVGGCGCGGSDVEGRDVGLVADAVVGLGAVDGGASGAVGEVRGVVLSGCGGGVVGDGVVGVVLAGLSSCGSMGEGIEWGLVGLLLKSASWRIVVLGD